MLWLSGEFDMGGELAFESELDLLLRNTPRTVLIDLAKLSFLDSTGLRALIRARQRGEREGWDLALSRPSKPVERILELTRTARLFRIVPEPDGFAEPRV